MQLRLYVGKYLVSLAFELFGTTNDQYHIKEQRKVDKLTKASRRCNKAQTSIPQLVLDKLKNSDFTDLNILCDTWFTSPNFIKNICQIGFEFIDMYISNDNKHTTIDGTEITTKNELNKIQKAIKQRESFGQIAKSIQVYVDQYDGSKILCKIVFAKNWINDNKSLKKHTLPFVI